MRYLLEKEVTDHLYFRPIELSDFDDWLNFFKDPQSFLHWKGERQSPEVECEMWYKKQFNRYETSQGGMNALIEKETGKLIGHAGLLVQQVDDITELEIGYSLLASGRSKGFATEAAIKCRDYAFAHHYADSLISIISLTNVPSVKVALKNGMRLDKQTNYHENEVNIFRISKTDWQNLNNNIT